MTKRRANPLVAKLKRLGACDEAIEAVSSSSASVPRPRCPKCGDHMIRRDGPNNPFYGCGSWPKCNGTRSIEARNRA